jgi:hypothetical protein
MATAGKVDLGGDGFFVLVDLLEAAKTGLPDEVPSPLDAQFSEIARAYRKAEPALRQQVREQIPMEYWLPLLELGDRCAEWALADKDPQKRYPSALELAEDLRRFLALAGKLRKIARDPVTEIELASLNQEHRPHADDRLGDRGHVEHRIKQIAKFIRPWPTAGALRGLLARHEAGRGNARLCSRHRRHHSKAARHGRPA